MVLRSQPLQFAGANSAAQFSNPAITSDRPTMRLAQANFFFIDTPVALLRRAREDKRRRDDTAAILHLKRDRLARLNALAEFLAD